uniref:Ig-like domain-containing protein n=1 Tax=Dicentrarchus labrax TaxID=13489 RepID=A0A8C4DWH0_DICLA
SMSPSLMEHSLKFFFAGFSGVTNYPEFIGAVMVDGVEVVHYDSNIKRAEPKQDWMKRLMEDDPGHRDWYTDGCRVNQRFFSSTIDISVSLLGIHTFQRIYGCDWKDKTPEVIGCDEFKYDGEDFIRLDPKTLEWNNSTPQAFITKQEWDSDKATINNIKFNLTRHCPQLLNKYLDYGKSSLLRTDPYFSVSFSLFCRASLSFYPDRATLFWRKDGKELPIEGRVEVLPNNDGTFQMSVDQVPPVIPEDWGRYDCVFHINGLVINVCSVGLVPVPSPASSDGGVTGGVAAAVFVVVAAFITGYFIWRKKCHAEKGQTRNVSIVFDNTFNLSSHRSIYTLLIPCWRNSSFHSFLFHTH